MKRIQNRIAESRMALPYVAVYAAVVWLLAGLVSGVWWLQFGCMAVSTFLMMVLNNQNALIRIYSRMVSCCFLVIACAGCFLFPSVRASVTSLCFIATLLLLFHTYQDKRSTGGTFYAFCMVGLLSLIHVRILYFVPVFWMLMAFKLQSLSWRTFLSSVVGLLLPYWLLAPYFAWQGDVAPMLEHFEQLGWVTFPADYAVLTTSQILYYCLLVVLATIGTVHFLRKRYQDKIRTRLMYDGFIILTWLALLMLGLQPQHDTLLLPVAIICVSPLVGHLIALTNTRWTNITFYVITLLTLLLTAYNIWTLS